MPGLLVDSPDSDFGLDSDSEWVLHHRPGVSNW